MTITILDPRTGRRTTLTIPDKPARRSEERTGSHEGASAGR
jgi:hypothetical protein